MPSSTDQKLDTAARALNKVAGPVGDAVANTVLAPFRSPARCTCNDRNHKH